MAPDAVDMIKCLLVKHPLERIGAGGAHELKEHMFFGGLDWSNLLREKAEFIPQLDDDEDTSYFDSKLF